MTNNEFPSLSPELADRTPNCIGSWLRDLWEKHTGKARSFITEVAWVSRPAKEYSGFDLHKYEVVLALEFLNQNGGVKNAGGVIENGQLSGNISEADWQKFIEKAPLKDLKVGVIGGPEARIFAEMGANAVGFDPHLNKLPSTALSNLQEYSTDLTHQLAQKNANRFDLTLSSWLFDQGSGLPASDFGILADILSMTKKSGFSIHNGNLMPAIVNQSSLADAVLKIVPPFRGYRLGDSPVYFILQKR